MACLLFAISGYFFVKTGSEMADVVMEKSTNGLLAIESITQTVGRLPSQWAEERQRKQYTESSNQIRRKYGLT